MVVRYDVPFSEEELLLKSKYDKLRKKKQKLKKSQQSNSGNQVTLSNNPSVHNKSSVKSPDTFHSSSSPSKSAFATAKTAKEAAAKLVKSGAISTSQGRNQDVAKKSSGFKRSQGLERKLSSMDARAGYQPYSSAHGPSGGFDTGGEDLSPNIQETDPSQGSNLYNKLIKERTMEERHAKHDIVSNIATDGGIPRPGNTIYVFAYNLTESLAKEAFSTYGKIVNMNVEKERNSAFITFENPSSAQSAINDRHNSVIEGVHLKVCFAKRQPVIEPINDASSSSAWSSIAANQSQKGFHKDSRDLETYEEPPF